jgi:Putative protein-S-isoprenylcysteine methyltransferase
MPTAVFASNTAAITFAAAFIAFFVCEEIGGVIIPHIRRGGARVKRKNVGSNTLTLTSWIATMSIPIVLSKLEIGLLPEWVFYLGIAAMAAGIVFRQWAIAVLGRFFSGVIGVQDQQKVVKSGPYRWIRHPSYTGVLIFIVGMGLALQSWAAVLANIAVFAIAYGSRIYIEEKVLVRELGEDYVEYRKHTKRVIPYLV